MKRQDVALLLSTDLRAVLADVSAGLDALHAWPVPDAAAVGPLLRAYAALAGREYQRS